MKPTAVITHAQIHPGKAQNSKRRAQLLPMALVPVLQLPHGHGPQVRFTWAALTRARFHSCPPPLGAPSANPVHACHPYCHSYCRRCRSRFRPCCRSNSSFSWQLPALSPGHCSCSCCCSKGTQTMVRKLMAAATWATASATATTWAAAGRRRPWWLRQAPAVPKREQICAIKTDEEEARPGGERRGHREASRRAHQKKTTLPFC